MNKEYFIERLKEATEEGWEKALATYEDDVAEGFIEEEEDETEAFWRAIREHEELEEPINPYII